MRLIFTYIFLFFLSFQLPAQLNTVAVKQTPVCGLVQTNPDMQKGLIGTDAALNSGSVNQAAPEKEKNKVMIRCVGTSFRSDGKPLFIVDGLPAESKQLSPINPNDIDSIWILKSAEATAIYGPEGVNGAIIVITRIYKLREFVVKDFLNEELLSGATVRFTRLPYKKDTLNYVADENGLVSTRKLVIGGEYEAVITSVGYKPLTVKLNTGFINTQTSFLLERDVKEHKPVVVSATFCPKRISCAYSITKVSDCSMRMFSDTVITNSLLHNLSVLKETRVYPNPISRGQAVTITTLSEQNNSLQIMVTDIAGKIVLQQLFKASKGSSQFIINTDSRWTAGMYVVQLKDEKGVLLKTEKIVVR
jgi:TonB-dependent SusC/RagA subfamily outer membrane receptor